MRRATAKTAHVETEEPRQIKVPQHKEFARRMAQACDGNRDVPLPNYGRLGWFVEQLRERHGIDATPETVRKWFAGEALPRHKSMHALAEILKVDEAWLSIGKAVELDAREQKLRNATADGVVNVVAGFIQMHGANPAFPAPNDARAKAEHIDIYAIIRGVQYAFHVALANEEDKHWRFVVPVGAENIFTLGVVPSGPTAVELIEIDPAGLLEHGSRKGGFTELKVTANYTVGGHKFKRVENFSERL